MKDVSNKLLDFRNCDNMELMKQFDDNHFDLAIVDPPYGIGDTWTKSRRDRFSHKGKLHDYQNTEIPDESYFNELFRVSKEQIIWGGNYFTEILPPTNAWIVWDKKHGNSKFMSDGELAWTSFKKPLKIVPLLWDGARKCEDVKKWHQHQKPVKLYDWILKNYTKEGDTVLDTHLGSGSVAIACHYAGIHLTCCEIDEKYFESSANMIEQITSQTRLL